MLATVRPLGQHGRGRVGADVAGDARTDEHPRRGKLQTEIDGRGAHRLGAGQGERRLTERGRVDAQHDVVHDRVADDHDVEQLVGRLAGLAQQIGDQLVESGADARRQLLVAARVHHHVRDPAHQVFAEPDLRVHHPGSRQHLAGRQVAEMAGDRRRADIDGDAERRVDEPRPDGDRGGVAIDGDGDGSVIVGGRPVSGAQHRGAPAAHDEIMRSNDRLADQFGHRLRIAQHGLGHVDVEQRELRIDDQTGEIDRLAHDLLVDLALRGHGDHRVGEHGRRATEAAAFAQRPAGVALGLVVDFDR